MSLIDRIKELFGGSRSGAEAASVATLGAVAGSADEDDRGSSDGNDGGNSSGAFDFGGGSGDSGGGAT